MLQGHATRTPRISIEVDEFSVVRQIAEELEAADSSPSWWPPAATSGRSPSGPGHNNEAFTLTRYRELFEDGSDEAADRLDVLLGGTDPASAQVVELRRTEES